MASLMLVEDHAVMIESLSFLLSRVQGLTITATATSAEAALAKLPEIAVDLVLIDVSLPQMSGIELIACLQKQHPELLCLVLSGHDELIYVQQSLAAGARGYVQKDQPITLLDAIPRVLAGEVYISAEMQRRLEG